MSVLIVGAGAAGGYIGAQLLAAGREVTFLARGHTAARLNNGGLRIRHGDDTRTVRVRAVTAAELDRHADVVILAVRAGAVDGAISDMRASVAADTRIIPVMNGIRHLSVLAEAFGQDRVLGSTTRLITSQAPDGTIDEIVPGVQMEIGQLDGGDSDALTAVVTKLDVPDIDVTVRADIVAAMWEKFAFITSMAVLTCLIGDVVGPIARAEGGTDLARGVLAEVAAIAAAEGYPLADAVHSRFDAMLTDTTSSFGPSMFRDMSAGRPVEVAVLNDLADHARTHQLSTPLLDASIVRIDVHNRRVDAEQRG
jgi:2-dehydropantoate 2-reductase